VDGAVASAELLASARGGDASAFALLLDPLWEPAYRLAFSMLSERESAEDAVQEAALKAWRAVRGLRPDTASVRPWFFTIVANQCRSMRRNRWSGVLRFANLVQPEDVRRTDLDTSLDPARALHGLPSEVRLVLALRYYLDLPIDEVAEILGISLAATKSRIRRGLIALEKSLNREDGER
jgi:RNA polymerase sigma-70 factor (ECF subfamily)